MMWCMVTRRTCSRSSRRARCSRIRGPRARSNGRVAASRASRPRSASRADAGISRRSTVAMGTSTAGAMTCQTRPSTRLKVVRNASWRRSTVSRLCLRMPSSSGPLSRTAYERFEAAAADGRWWRCQSCSCATDAGNGGRRGMAGMAVGAASGGAASMSRAMSATVGVSKKRGSVTATCVAACMRERSCMARRECPPSSKKLSCTPTCSTPRDSAQMPARSASVALPGATNPSSSSGRSRSGAGRAADRPFRSGSAEGDRRPRTPRAPSRRAPAARGTGAARSWWEGARRRSRRRRRGAGRPGKSSRSDDGGLAHGRVLLEGQPRLSPARCGIRGA